MNQSMAWWIIEDSVGLRGWVNGAGWVMMGEGGWVTRMGNVGG